MSGGCPAVGNLNDQNWGVSVIAVTVEQDGPHLGNRLPVGVAKSDRAASRWAERYETLRGAGGFHRGVRMRPGRPFIDEAFKIRGATRESEARGGPWERTCLCGRAGACAAGTSRRRPLAQRSRLSKRRDRGSCMP